MGSSASRIHPGSMASSDAFYALTCTTLRGKPFSFAELRGKPVLIVNVASKCGFTPQYGSLETLYSTYKDKGLVILGFRKRIPRSRFLTGFMLACNQFQQQEPGGADEIEACQLNYGVTFPIMEKVQRRRLCPSDSLGKVNVNGPETHPVFEHLKNEKRGILGLSRVKWNFEKFLVDRQGRVVKRYASNTKPESIAPDVATVVQ